MAGYQIALDRTFHLRDTRWGALAVSEGFDGHPPVTMDGESALVGSKTWVPGAPYIDTVMIRGARSRLDLRPNRSAVWWCYDRA